MIVKGWASTDNVDYVGHVVASGAFEESIKLKGLNGPDSVKLLIGHKMDKPAGRITELAYRKNGLWIEAWLDEKISYVKDMAQAIRANEGFSFSVGYMTEEADVVSVDDYSEYLEVTKGELMEVSVVVEPANPYARITEYSDDT